MNIWTVVHSNTFTFLARSVAKLSRCEGSCADSIRFSEADQLQPLPADDFKPTMFQCFEMLV